MVKPLQLCHAKQTMQNQLYEGAQSGCGPFGAIFNRDDVLELGYHCLGHLNTKGVYMLQNMVSDMNIGKF